MTKPKATPAPEVVSRENAIGARSVESCFDPVSEEAALAGDLHAMGTVPGMTAANFPGTIEPASHATQGETDTREEQGPIDDGGVLYSLRNHEQAMGNASHANPEGWTDREQLGDNWGRARRLMPGTDRTQGMGDVPAMPAVEPAPVEVSRTHARDVTKRLQAEGRWFGQAETVRDEMMSVCKGRMTKDEAQKWVYSELDRLYPKLPSVNDSDTISETPHLSPYVPTKGLADVQQDSGAIQGLSEIPEGWPTLPANASLGAELGWVQANRLRIVEERPGRATSVKLGQALSPAPSWAALGWLETSIRSYAKFVDVAAKASGVEDDEGAVLRRERKSVDEVRALLDEMKQAEGSCPACGRPH
jgi:hypothetical protein